MYNFGQRKNHGLIGIQGIGISERYVLGVTAGRDVLLQMNV